MAGGVQSMGTFLIPIAATHGHVLAALHAEAFDNPWSAQSFSSALAQPGAFGFIVEDAGGEPLGFVLMRAVGASGETDGEAEVLTIATRPSVRRRGVAVTALKAALAHAKGLGAGRAFLEVACDNAPALALYERLGFVEVGRRAGYYARPGGGVDAVLMARNL